MTPHQGLGIGLCGQQVDHSAAAVMKETLERGSPWFGPTSSLCPSIMAAPSMNLLQYLLALGPTPCHPFYLWELSGFEGLSSLSRSWSWWVVVQEFLVPFPLHHVASSLLSDLFPGYLWIEEIVTCGSWHVGELACPWNVTCRSILVFQNRLWLR